MLIYSDQHYVNVVSLLLTLESISPNPGLPGSTGKILVLKLKFEFEM